MHSTSLSLSLSIHIAIVDSIDDSGDVDYGELPKGNCGANVRLQLDDQTKTAPAARAPPARDDLLV